MHNLANSYAALGRFADALSLDEEIVAGRKALLGPTHLATLQGLTNLAASYRMVGRQADALRAIDDFLTNAKAGQANTGWVGRVCSMRAEHFQKAGDPAGCRTTAEVWERFGFDDAISRYNAACLRAVAAGVYAKKGQPAEAAADSDKAMAWLRKAVAAGFRDRTHIEQDADLDALRGRPDFKAVVGSLPYPAPPPREAKR